MKSNTEILREWTEEDWSSAIVSPGACSDLQYVMASITAESSTTGVVANLAYLDNTDSIALILKNLNDVIRIGPAFKLSEINPTICAELMLLAKAAEMGARLALANVFTAMKIMKGENDDKSDGTQESQNIDN